MQRLAGDGWRRVRGSWAAVAQPVEDSRRWRWILGSALAAAFLLAGGGAAAWQTCGFAGCPDVARLAAFRPGGAPLLLDRHGEVIAALSPDDAREVRLAALPSYLPAAFVAIEDRRFYDHGAVDWRRACGALAANLRARALTQGSSTLSMQLARNLFPQEIPGQQRTLARKLLEIRVAQDFELRWSKPEILEMYLNHIYFGNGARGVEAAAWQYFRTPASRLTLEQAALLAALPKAPRLYDPRRHPERALARRNLVLASMAAQGRIGRPAADAAARQPLGLRPAPERPPGGPVLARFFVEEVRHQMEDRFGVGLFERPVRIWTTLDLAAQRAAEEELESQLRGIEARNHRHGERAGGGAKNERPMVQAAAGNGERAGSAGAGTGEELEGAVVAMAVDSGDVLAWVGGRPDAPLGFDRVASARRQVGSLWKPFVYATALANGVALSQVIADTPLTVPLAGGGTWEPRNFDDSFDGRVTLREALARSKNVPTVRLAEAVGYGRIADLAASDGIPADGPLLPSMALGTVEASPLKLTAAYTTFASLGWRAAPRLVTRIERADGTTLWTAPPPSRRQVLDAAVTYLLDDALRDALIRGSGAPGLPAGFAGRAAGKTGTSTGGNDVWFVGFTPEVVAGVWIGYDAPRPVANQATGGRLAAPVFRRLMTRLYSGRPAPAWWPRPAGVQALPIDPASGLVLSAGCTPAGGGPQGTELFLSGREPRSTCPSDGEMVMTASLVGGAEGSGEAGAVRTTSAAGGGLVLGDRQAAVLPAAGAVEVAASPVDLSGWWDITTSTAGSGGEGGGDSAGGPGGEASLGGAGQRTYRVALRQDGMAVSGEGGGSGGGRIVGADGADGSVAAGTAQRHIQLAGTIQGREVRLRFTETAPGSSVTGTMAWRLAPSGADLTGTFFLPASDTRGTSSAVRLH